MGSSGIGEVHLIMRARSSTKAWSSCQTLANKTRTVLLSIRIQALSHKNNPFPVADSLLRDDSLPNDNAILPQSARSTLHHLIAAEFRSIIAARETSSRLVLTTLNDIEKIIHFRGTWAEGKRRFAESTRASHPELLVTVLTYTGFLLNERFQIFSAIQPEISRNA